MEPGNLETDTNGLDAPVVQTKESVYICYILESVDGKRTYAGITNNMARRLRQHNGELAGGAKYTSKPQSRPWKVVLTVNGFQTKVQALQFEWALHHTKGEGGVPGRMQKLVKVLKKAHWTKSAPAASAVPLVLQVQAATPPPKLCADKLPNYVTVNFIDTQTVEMRTA